MLTECPHCFTRVLARPDGQCPSCQQSMLNVRGAQREFMTVTVGENSQMPDYCCILHDPRTTVGACCTLARRLGGPGDSGIWAVAAFLLHGVVGVLSLLMQVLHSDKQSGSQMVVVRIRQCRECSRRQPLEPVFVNYDGYNMKFVVIAISRSSSQN